MDECKHANQAARNETVYRDVLDGPDAIYSEWAVTTLFYAASHWAEAFLARRNLHIVGHKNRIDAVRNQGKPRAAASLKKLWGKSTEARYEGARFAPDAIRRYESDYERFLVELQ